MKKRMPVHTVRPAESTSIVLPAAIRVFDQMENSSGDNFIAVWVLQEKMLNAREELQDMCESMRACQHAATWAENSEYHDEMSWEAHCYEGYMKDALAEYLSLREKLFALL